MSASASVGIVVGVDDSPASDVAIGWATRNAVERRLPLVHAVNVFAVTWPDGREIPDVGSWQEGTGRRILDDAVNVANGSKFGLSKRAELVVWATGRERSLAMF